MLDLIKMADVSKGIVMWLTVDDRYSRKSTDVKALGTFGKQKGRQALRHLQTMFQENIR